MGMLIANTRVKFMFISVFVDQSRDSAVVQLLWSVITSIHRFYVLYLRNLWVIFYIQNILIILGCVLAKQLLSVFLVTSGQYRIPGSEVINYWD